MYTRHPSLTDGYNRPSIPCGIVDMSLYHNKLAAVGKLAHHEWLTK
jgi:hypothetical protein